MSYIRTLRYLQEAYPTIEWSLIEPREDVKKNFGQGLVIKGTCSGKSESFFVLYDDKNKGKWGDIIAAKLIGTEEEDATE